MTQALYFEVMPMVCPECRREIQHAWCAGSGKLRCPLCTAVFEDSRVEAVKRKPVSPEELQEALKEYQKKWEQEMTEKVYELPEFGIRVGLCLDADGKAHGGSIDSELVKPDMKLAFDDPKDFEVYKAGMDAIESMILAHAMAGIVIDFPEYVEGVRTVIEAIENRHGL